MASTPASSKRVATLGMFILDTFVYEDPTARPPGSPEDLQVGGAGVYTAIGARVWLDPSRIRCIVDKGRDFPAGVQAQLDTFGPDMWTIRDDPGRQTTTAVNVYRRSGRRDFDYLTPRNRLHFSDLLGSDPSSATPASLPSYIHLVSYTWRVKELLGELDQIAAEYPNLKDWKPGLIYEPMPDQWSPTELDAIAPVAHKLYCLSPNHDEAAAFCGLPPSQAADKATIEDITHRLLALGPRVAIVRSGALGAFVASKHSSGWIPPAVTEQSKVVDVTGCGNAFLGGYMAGLADDLDDLEAASRGAISAGVTLMQYGPPTVTRSSSGGEGWSGQGSADDLLQSFRDRLG